MGMVGPADSNLGSVLIDAGWQQGSLFTAAAVAFTYNKLHPQEADQFALAPLRYPKAQELFVLVTQTCDIKANSNEEPYVEALLCKFEKSAKMLASADRNSARRFLIDPDTGLIAQAKYRVTLSKDLLATLTPEAWPSSPDRFERFVRWLARRYDRPAIPDIIVDVLQKPIETTLSRLDTEMPDISLAFSQAIQEIRVNLPERETPPFDLQLVLLLKNNELSEEEYQAIQTTFSQIQVSLDTEMVHLDPEIRMLTEEEISVAEYRATRPLFLEYLTYKGDEVKGATPSSHT